MITGKESEYKSIADLKGTPLGISRPGSGSQTMASVMALQQGWDTSALEFKGESILTTSSAFATGASFRCCLTLAVIVATITMDQ